MLIVSTLSFLLTMLVGHQNLFVALFGWRIYAYHFPMIFVMGKVLTRTDLLKMIQFILLASIPITILIFFQFHSPQSAWVNMGVGGEGSSGFAGALGYFRPSGTFSFTSGYVLYQGVVGTMLLYYTIMNRTLPKQFQLPDWLLMVLLACYLISIPTSISRTHFFQTCVYIAFLAIAMMRKAALTNQMIKFTFITIAALVLLSALNIGTESIEAFTARFEVANKIEGGTKGVLGNRYLGGYLGTLFDMDGPIFGYGLGLGTNVGAKIMGGNMYSFGFNAENEWGRVIGECGFLLGIFILAVRVIFSFKLMKAAFRCVTHRFDLLPWMLTAGMLLTVPQGQWAVPANLGFCIFFGGFTLAAVRTSK